MSSSYPSSIDSLFTNRQNSTQSKDNHAADHNTANDAIMKIETELGPDPSGVYSNVKARLEYLQSLADAATGPPGPSGSVGLGINVLDLDPNPASVTDWGPLINTALGGGARHFLFPDSQEYPISTSLDASGLVGVTFEGDSGSMWAGNEFFGTRTKSRIVWKGGAGTGPAIDATATSGFQLRNLGVYWDNAAFDGDLIDLSVVAASPMIEYCNIGHPANLTGARCLLNMDKSIVATIRNNFFRGGDFQIIGRQGSGSFSNANWFIGNTHADAGTAFYGNIWEQWQILLNTFELGETGAIIDNDGSNPEDGWASMFTFAGNWCGDFQGTARPMFRQRAGNYWRCTFRDNTFSTAGGPIWDLQSGGEIRIKDNPYVLRTDDSEAIVDAGDVGAGVPRKAYLEVTGNAFNATTDEVDNFSGHKIVIIGNNGDAAGPHDLQMVRGHEVVGYRTTYNSPTIAALAAAGTGPTKAIYGSDRAGEITYNSGSGASAGQILEVTFGDVYETHYNSPLARVQVTLTPKSSAAASALAYVVDEDRKDGFKIATVNTLSGDGRWVYRVIAC